MPGAGAGQPERAVRGPDQPRRAHGALGVQPWCAASSPPEPVAALELHARGWLCLGHCPVRAKPCIRTGAKVAAYKTARLACRPPCAAPSMWAQAPAGLCFKPESIVALLRADGKGAGGDTAQKRCTDNDEDRHISETGAALTECCDLDVEYACDSGANHKRGVFSIGAVGRCLARQLASGDALDPECRQLVMAAAPSVSISNKLLTPFRSGLLLLRLLYGGCAA